MVKKPVRGKKQKRKAAEKNNEGGKTKILENKNFMYCPPPSSNVIAFHFN